MSSLSFFTMNCPPLVTLLIFCFFLVKILELRIQIDVSCQDIISIHFENHSQSLKFFYFVSNLLNLLREYIFYALQ
jgi:hypothetical protein